MQSVPITTKIVSSNLAHGEVYSIQHYVIKFVSDLRHVGGFLCVLRFPPPIKYPPRYNWNIVESVVKHHNPKPLTRSTTTAQRNSTVLLTTRLMYYK